MSEIERARPERYYRAYQRTAVVCLLAAVAVGGYFLAIGAGALRGGAREDAAVSLAVLVAFALLAVPAVTLRARWRPSDPGVQRVLRDEWTRRNWGRACRVGFGAVMWAQFPLALLLERLAPAPALPVMAGLSMTLGLGAFWATYLYVGRQPADELPGE